MNLLAPVARPIFRWNHNVVMRQGGRGARRAARRAAPGRHVAFRRDARARHRRRRLHRLPLRQAAPRRGRRRARARQADLLRQPGEPRRHRASSSSSATSATPRRSPRRRRAATRSSTSRPRRTSTARSSARPSSSRPNVAGTQVLLDHVRGAGIRLVHVSTDEVYGDVPRGVSSVEDDPLRPSSPYSAAKAGGDLQVLGSVRTYGVDALITRGSNTYGPNQYPEKLLPLFVTNALDGEPLPLYGDGAQVRDWLYVEDHCAGIELALRRGRGRRGLQHRRRRGGDERGDHAARARAHRRRRALVRPVEDRAGHDRRYSLDTTKIRGSSAGSRGMRLAEGFPRTAAWYAREPRLVGADQALRRLSRVLREAVRRPARGLVGLATPQPPLGLLLQLARSPSGPPAPASSARAARARRRSCPSVKRVNARL